MKPVASDTVDLCDWSTGARSDTQSYGRRCTARRNIVTSVRLNRSHLPLACGRYAVVRVLSTPTVAHNSAKSADSNCVPQSECSCSGTP